MLNQLKKALSDKTALIGVIGLGYVGLPLIRAFVKSGFTTLGFDVDPKKVDELNAGRSYIEHIPSEWIAECVAEKRFSSTADMSRLAEADVLLICVPTPLSDSRDPDLTYVEETTKEIAKTLRPGQLVILESTTYPGTTRDVMLPILEASGRKAGKDFFLAYSPEREDPGNPDFSAERIPKVVGGLDAASLELAEILYGHAVVQVVPVSSVEVAEACKIVENTYRSVNIAMVNELKMLFDRLGIDIWEVIRGASTKPFGFQAFYPGPGLGGHCIPIDPFYLSWVARKGGAADAIHRAGRRNQHVDAGLRHPPPDGGAERPGQGAEGEQGVRLGCRLQKRRRRPRESPSFVLMERLLARGADLTYHDPHIPTLPSMRHHNLPAMESKALTPEFLATQDCILIATNHSSCDYAEIVKHAPLVVDTRNATAAVTEGRERIVKA